MTNFTEIEQQNFLKLKKSQIVKSKLISLTRNETSKMELIEKKLKEQNIEINFSEVMRSGFNKELDSILSQLNK